MAAGPSLPCSTAVRLWRVACLDAPAASDSGWHLPLWLRGWLLWLLQLALFSRKAHSAAPTFQATAMPQCWQPAPFPPSPCNPAGRLGTFNCLQFLQQFSLASYTLLCFSNCQHSHILVLISLYNPLIGAPGPAGICGALDTSFLFDSCIQAPNVPPTLSVTIWDTHGWNPFWAVPDTGPMVADASPKRIHSKC